jgi:hypothetical protein
MKWTAESILKFLADHETKLQELGAEKIGLFGSYARGEQTPNSDIDLLVSLKEERFTVYMGVWNFLEDQLGEKVDLVIEQNLRAALRPYVMAEVRYATHS